MLISTEGIVLHSIKYGDSSLISTIYTRDYGRQSYLVNGARSTKSKNKAGLLQPLHLVELAAYQKQTRELHRIKELKSRSVYQNLPFDIVKSTVAIFLAEMLYKSINEQESYPELYEFLLHSFLYFDLMETGASNFHLWFLLRLTEYLGFLPSLEKAGFQNWFDMKKGAIVPFQPSHPFCANKAVTESLLQLATFKLPVVHNFHLSRSMREALLTTLVDYYQLHFDSLGEIKSLEVLREVFR